MKDFGFSLAPHTSLKADAGNYFLLSSAPIRLLRLNKPLYRLLEHLHDGGELSEYVKANPGLDTGHLLRTLLALVGGGYLRMERIAELEEYPSVSIIIPVRDQPEHLVECLKSLEKLDYPRDRLEIIVVDDGSEKEAAQIITSPDIKVIRQEESRGQAVCRNLGAEQANSDILAFIDADCVAGEKWLKEIVPFFRASEVGAVGGYVDGYYNRSFLDRYEKVATSLNIGERLILEGKNESSFYVPTANLLVTREAFRETGGFKAGMHLGEDVDFCWRLRNLGYTLVYIPFGRVAHKHRNHLGKMLKRRGEYGTSEATLYRACRDKRKTFLISLYAGLSFLALTLAIMLMNPYPLIAVPLLFSLDLWQKTRILKKNKMTLSFNQTVYATLRSYVAFVYFAFFHLVRYYLILILAFGFLWAPLWLFGGLAIVYTSIVDFSTKKPELFYPVFLFFYLLEHLAYQIGVFWGCLRQRYFGSYMVTFKRARQ